MPERWAAAARFGIEAVDLNQTDDSAGMLIEMTGGRGPDAVIDHLPLEEAPHGYEIFRDKADGCIKVVLQP